MGSLHRRAFISTQAVVANARTLADGATLRDVIVDLRGDAYGHGMHQIAAALAEAGVGGFVVSSLRDADALAVEHARLAINIGPAGPDDGRRLLGPGVYGLGAAPGPLHGAMRLVAEAVSVKRVPRGRGVSYGYTYRTERETTLVLAGLGYADGVPRVASNRAPVAVGSIRSRVTGRVAMDQFVVDIGDGAASAGDEVVLFGEASRGEPTLLEWSEKTGLGPEVIATGIGPRVERVYT